MASRLVTGFPVSAAPAPALPLTLARRSTGRMRGRTGPTGRDTAPTPVWLPIRHPRHTVKGKHVGSKTSIGTSSERIVVVLGIILLIIGLVTGISVLWTIGIILAVIGAVLWLLGTVGHAVGGRRHYW